MEIGSEKLSCVTKNLHPQQGLLDSLPEQSKGGGGGWWDMRGGEEKNLAFKGGVSDGFVKMQIAYQNAKNQRS